MDKQQVTINVANAPWIQCDCGSHTFNSKMMFKKISQFESPTGKEEQIPIDIVVCDSCGKIPTFVSDKIKGIPENLLATKSLIIDGK